MGTYKIIGADGQEYGPVSVDQVRAWIKEGRCNAQTRAQAEGTLDWQPLPLFPEFAGSFVPPSPTPNALPPPPPSGSGPGRPTDSLLSRDCNLDVGGCFGRGWNLLTANFWPAVGITFLATLMMGVPIVNYVVSAGILHYFIKLRRGEKAVLEDLFAGFSDRFLHLFLAGLVGHLLEGVGFLFCILPGIYLAVAWQFSLPLVLERKMDFWDAMELSRKVVSKHWFALFGLVLLGILIQFVGLLACIIGIYITIPWGFAATACAYHDLFEPDTGTPVRFVIPSVPPASGPPAPSPVSPGSVAPI